MKQTLIIPEFKKIKAKRTLIHALKKIKMKQTLLISTKFEAKQILPIPHIRKIKVKQTLFIPVRRKKVGSSCDHERSGLIDCCSTCCEMIKAVVNLDHQTFPGTAINFVWI
jgi:hypothetical protein